MYLFIHIRNLLVRAFWRSFLFVYFEKVHYQRAFRLDQGANGLKVVYRANSSSRSVWHGQIRVKGKIHFVILGRYDCAPSADSTPSFSIVSRRNGTELSLPTHEALQEYFWEWAASGEAALGHCLNLANTMISLSQINLLRRDLLLRGLGKVGVALEGLLGSSPNYRALYGYVDRVDLCALGNIMDLRDAVNAPLVVGGRRR